MYVTDVTYVQKHYTTRWYVYITKWKLLKTYMKPYGTWKSRCLFETIIFRFYPLVPRGRFPILLRFRLRDELLVSVEYCHMKSENHFEMKRNITFNNFCPWNLYKITSWVRRGLFLNSSFGSHTWYLLEAEPLFCPAMADLRLPSDAKKTVPGVQIFRAKSLVSQQGRWLDSFVQWKGFVKVTLKKGFTVLGWEGSPKLDVMKPLTIET